MTPAPLLGASLHVPGAVTRARLYATAHGVYTATLNGRRVGDHVLAPGWTSYHHRLRYQTYDVTDLVRERRQRARGPARQRLVPRPARLRGDRRAVTATGWRCSPSSRSPPPTAHVHVLATDETWTARESGVLADDLYDGQRTDLAAAATATAATRWTCSTATSAGSSRPTGRRCASPRCCPARE